MPGALLAPIIAVIIVVVLAAIAITRFSRRTREHSDALQFADRPTVRYLVPPGQDPANVLTQLRQAGYDANPDSEPGPASPILIIGTTHGGEPDRDHLRQVLADTTRDVDPTVDSETELSPASVRFMDE
jgi:hypothetical protein